MTRNGTRRRRESVPAEPIGDVLNTVARVRKVVGSSDLDDDNPLGEPQQRQGILQGTARFPHIFPTDDDASKIRLVDARGGHQHRPARAQDQVRKVDVARVVDNRSTRVGAGNQKVSGPRLLGDIVGDRTIGYDRRPPLKRHPPAFK